MREKVFDKICFTILLGARYAEGIEQPNIGREYKEN